MKLRRTGKHSAIAVREAKRRSEELKSIRELGGCSKIKGELRFVRTWIDAALLAAEPELELLAWVENRLLTPLERTEVFAHDYATKYRRALVKARRPVGMPIADSFAMNTPAEMNALWRARAEADRLGMPYDLYLDVVIDGHLEADKWRRPPRPNQLYGKLDGPRLRGRPTSEEASVRLACMATNPFFGADAYTGNPVQGAGLEVLRADVEAAKDPASRLALYLVDWRMITRDRAAAIFGSAMVDAAIALRGAPATSSGAAETPYRPTCFGHYSNRDSAPCRSCPVLVECQGISAEVSAELIRTTGTANPRLAHKRRIDMERQRRHRQKKKTEKS
jgi:hypothetical protein